MSISQGLVKKIMIESYNETLKYNEIIFKK